MAGKTTNNAWQKLGESNVLEPTKFNDALDAIDAALGAVVSGAQALTAVNAADASLDIVGLAATQGGTVVTTGGTSSTSGNAGGAVADVGGTPGATGVGGAVTAVGGIGGATSGAGGAVTNTGGAGTNGNGAGGAVANTGGAGQGSAAGGAVTDTGGAGGATGAGGAATVKGGAGGATSGTGGTANVTGGAGSGGNANGGSVLLTGGAPNGSGKSGVVFHRSKLFRTQGAPTAKTVTAAISAAELLTGIITTTGVTAPSIHQLPTGTLLLAEVPDAVAGDAFDFTLINTGTGASDDATITVNTDVTIVGSPTVGALTDATIISGSGRFRARYTGGVTFIVYRLA